MQVIFKTWKKAFDSDGTRLDIYYLVTSTPVVADTNAASNTVSTAAAHAAQTVATLNEDKTPDGVKTGFHLEQFLAPHLEGLILDIFPPNLPPLALPG